jgi:Xaa-Pro aminopeptidase
MNLFKAKNIERKINPQNNTFNFIKPRIFEDQIDFDRMRLYRLNRVRKQMELYNVGAVILFDPINIRYATDARNMSLFTMHTLTRYVFIPLSGPVILFDYPKAEHLSEHLNTINEIREAVSWDYFSAGEKVHEFATIWVKQVDDLMRNYSANNKNLAIDVCDPTGIQALQKIDNYNIGNAQIITESARSIKSEDEIMCLRASIKVAEMGIQKMHKNLIAGITEEELWANMHKTNIENGGEWFETRLLCSGSRTNPWLQECSNRIIQKGDLVAFDTDMVGPYGYCADISRTFVEGGELTYSQKNLHNLAVEQIKYNEGLVKPGITFREFANKAWKLPDNCYDNHYPCQIHGIGMCDEWPFIKYPNKDFSNGDFDSIFEENMILCLESYIGEVGGKEGIKLEDQYLVTKNGLELLSSFPLDQI